MSTQPNVVPTVPKSKKLSAKYSKLMEFGYAFVQMLNEKKIIADEAIETVYSDLKLFDSIEDQTIYYEQVLANSNQTGKTMRAFIRNRNKPPKAARKPRAKKTEKAKEEVLVEAQDAVNTTEPVNKVEKKERKPRTKKTTDVVQDTNDDLIGQLVAAANQTELETGSKAEEKVEAEEKVTPKKKAKGKTATSKEGDVKEKPKKERKQKPKKVETEVENTPEAIVQEVTVQEAIVEEELEEEEIQTNEIEVNGRSYLMDDDQTVYSIDTHEELGKFSVVFPNETAK